MCFGDALERKGCGRCTEFEVFNSVHRALATILGENQPIWISDRELVHHINSAPPLIIDEINIIPRYGGVIIHDCWASYLAYTHCGHGLCGSHLLRELTFIVDSNGYPWARNMKRLLQETCRKVAQSRHKKLDDKAYANLQKRYRNIMTRGAKQLPPIPPRPTGKRGKLAKSDAHNLWERLRDHEAAVLLFAKDPQVSFTNNRAEQDLRGGE